MTTVEINRRGTVSNGAERFLFVTSDGRLMEANVDTTSGCLRSYGGSIWPGQMPAVFRCTRPTAQVGQSTYMRRSILLAFVVSTASLRVPIDNTAAAAEIAADRSRDPHSQMNNPDHWASRRRLAIVEATEPF